MAVEKQTQKRGDYLSKCFLMRRSSDRWRHVRLAPLSAYDELAAQPKADPVLDGGVA